jgi:hypothetical protein
MRRTLIQSSARPVRLVATLLPAGRETTFRAVAAALMLATAGGPASSAEDDAPDANPVSGRDSPAVAAADGAAVAAPEEPVPRRPSMRQLGPSADPSRPPSRREIADGRTIVRRRFYEDFSHSETALGARVAAEALLSAATTEADPTLRWVLLDEARRLGESSGQAGIISRSFATAAGLYDFDDVAAELRSLEQIPVRVLDGGRATALAKSAEHLARRAADENRIPQAIAAESIAARAWQRAGNTAAAREATVRALELERR